PFPRLCLLPRKKAIFIAVGSQTANNRRRWKREAWLVSSVPLLSTRTGQIKRVSDTHRHTQTNVQTHVNTSWHSLKCNPLYQPCANTHTHTHTLSLSHTHIIHTDAQSKTHI